MKGHLRRRGSAWQLVVDAGRDPLTGRRRQITRTVRANRREAERQLTRAHEEDIGRLANPMQLRGVLSDEAFHGI